MKKFFLFICMTFFTFTLINVPFTANASNNVAKMGYYDTVEGTYYTIREFSKLPNSEKRTLFLKDGLYLFTGDFVISGKDVILTPDDKLDSKLILKEEFTAANLDEIYLNTVKPVEDFEVIDIN